MKDTNDSGFRQVTISMGVRVFVGVNLSIDVRDWGLV